MTSERPDRPGRRRLLAAGAAGALAVSGAVLVATPAAAAPSVNGCQNRVNASVDKLLTCVTPAGVTEHLANLQAIADGNDGNRASTTSGNTASVEYVRDTLEASGYEVSVTDFTYEEVSYAGSLARVTPSPATYALDTDYVPIDGTASAAVTAPVTGVDVSSGTSGCEAADFAGFATGSIALVQRGTCTFAIKVANAVAAGASGVVVYNNAPGLINPTLGGAVDVPVVFATPETGAGLLEPGTTATLDVQVVTETNVSQNITAELPGRSSDGVVVVGGHLDSVPEGPGINDNGSGSATILEVAQNLANTRLEHPVRFAFWGAEELGLLGSQAYVDSLSDDELARIGSYLNFDMLGSTNYANFVYDSDGSSFPAPEGYVSPESAAIEQTFEDFYDSRGIAYEDTEFDGRSDYQAFADAGIPSGGLFSGAEGIKTPEQAAAYGGTAGQPYDACYHQACDDLDNISQVALDQNSDAVAYAVLVTAQAGSGPGQGN
ncbi:M20/M25/M40 family metallo-hydrolase [Klenkia terrae]|uniref:M20/M25/M40 family metallo-hydrolase n=1 Tax=Klenkia terrae TaxID=1052259 RepID=A0ABU8E0S8_9ACTN|nr:M20/M25/M40 family metallo-hydrolase [Klenkia terrae]SSC22717.1 PA domain-containing protein with peptidase M28 domain [Klenkia terrae]